MPREVRYRNDESDEESEVARNVVAEGNSSGNISDAEAGHKKSAEEDEEGEDDGETYEIERIVHHKRGQLVPKKLAYFVKWKGYPETDNSWVLADDCNAPDLIKEYWDLHEAEQRAEGKGKSAKRGREVDVKMEEDQDLRPPKKPKKEKATSKSTKSKSRLDVGPSLTSRTKFRNVNDTADQDEEESSGDILHPQEEYGTMEDYWGEKDWTGIIAKVLTVDIASDSAGDVVYFLELKNGKLAATTTDFMAERAPAMALRFYEDNLKFMNFGTRA